MKKFGYLSSVILLLLLLGGCCKPCQEENTKLKSELESLKAENAEFTTELDIRMAVAPTRPLVMKSKWKYKKTYRLCVSATMGAAKQINVIIHRKNTTKIIQVTLVPPGTGIAQSSYLNTFLLPFDAYISIQAVDAAGSVTDLVIKDGPDVCTDPILTQRQSVKAENTGSTTTVAVTIDEL